MATEAEYKAWQELDIRNKAKVVEIMSFFPALTLTVFIRRKLGFRMVKPDWLYFMTAVLFVIPLLNTTYNNHVDPWPIVFGLAMLGLGIWHRWKRWVDICKGVVWHTFSPGISYMERLRLPLIILRERRLYRYVEPVLCLAVGLLMLKLSPLLGVWIAFAALCLAINENAYYQRLLERSLDTLDGLFEAQVQGEIVDHFTIPKSAQSGFALDDTGGIPTGIAADVDKQIEARRKKRPVPPNDLAAEPPSARA